MSAPDVRRGGSTPPRRPATRSGQWFRLGPWAFDIDTADRLLSASPRPVLALPVADWARACGLTPGPAGTAPLLGPGPDFDAGYAMTTSLGTPVTLAALEDSAARIARRLLIDGYHRLYKAAATGQAEIPALALTAAETLRVRYDIAPGPGGLIILKGQPGES